MNNLDYGKIFPIPQTKAEVATSVGTTEENFEHLRHHSVFQARPVAAPASDDRMEFSEAFRRKGSCVSLPNPGTAGKAKTEVPWKLGLCELPH